MTARLYSVLPHHITQVWPDVSPFLSEALKYDDGKWSLIDIRYAIERKDMQLFVVMDGDIKAAFVTEIRQYPCKKVMCVLFLGGRDVETWIHLISDLERWAEESGCDSMEIQGRKGWARLLGWDSVYTVIRKNIER